jgi:hypothetical protein
MELPDLRKNYCRRGSHGHQLMHYMQFGVEEAAVFIVGG